MPTPNMSLWSKSDRLNNRRGVRLWPLLFVMMGLSACYEHPALSTINALPKITPADPWRAVQPEAGIRVVVEVPATVSANAALIQARVTIANTNSKPREFSAPNSCRVDNWEILGPAGKPVAAKRPALCVAAVQSLTLAAGQKVTKTVILPLGPGVLRAGDRYRILVHFWGNPGAAVFRAG